MKLLIVEPEATGHHMALYVRLLVRNALCRGWHVSLLTTAQAIEHPAFQLVELEAGNELDIYFMEPAEKSRRSQVLTLIGQQYRYYSLMRNGFARLTSQYEPDVVYVSNLDYCDKVLAILGSPFAQVPFSGMMMSIKYHRHRLGIGPPSRSDRLYEWLFRRVLRIPTLRSSTIVDEAFYEYTKKAHYPEYNKLRLIPDAGELVGSESRYIARKKLGIPPEAFVILVYGSLSARKGIESLLAAVDSPQIPDKVEVVLAGTPDQMIKLLMKSFRANRLRATGKLNEYFGFHDDVQEYRVFRAADAVWIGYVGGSYGSSGVLIQAGSLKLPVIATRYGLIGWLTQRYQLGLTVDPGDTGATIDAIRLLHDDNTARQYLGNRAGAYAAGHSASRYGAAVCEAVIDPTVSCRI